MLFAIVLALTIGCIAFILAREGQGVPRPDGLRGRIHARGWGLLLLPVAMAAAVMAANAGGLIPLELGIAVLAIVFAPKLAAKLVPYGVLDPEVVRKLLGRHARTEPVARLTAREREVLALMAEGRSNAAIAERLFVTEKAVSKHAAGIFAKLDLDPLAPSDDDNRRVLAVLAYLDS